MPRLHVKPCAVDAHSHKECNHSTDPREHDRQSDGLFDHDRNKGTHLPAGKGDYKGRGGNGSTDPREHDRQSDGLFDHDRNKGTHLPAGKRDYKGRGGNGARILGTDK